MSLKKNTTANYISQIYTALIGIVMVPVYIRYMGLEAYGLVGFFAMLQALFQLLDIGLTPTISREVAQFRGGACSALTLRRIFFLLEITFLLVAFLGAIGIISFSGFIVHKWLKIQHLNFIQAQTSIILMGVTVALRWVSGLYKGAISGFEDFIWLSNCNIVINTLRFVSVILVFLFIGTGPIIFFSYQLTIACFELLLMFFKKNKLMPIVSLEQNALPWNWSILAKIFKFSVTIAFTNSVWILVMQTDKILLSKELPLKEYACYTLVVLVAGGISILTGPISAALLPRITSINARGEDRAFIELYRKATQVISAVSIPIVLVLSCLPMQVLHLWTGNIQVATNGMHVLRLYSIGNGLLGLSAFAYYLQFAKGDLKLHFIGNVSIVAIYIPLLIWSVHHFGMIGAGYAWLIKNALFFIVWMPVVHAKFIKGLHFKWLFNDIFKIAILPIIVIILSMYFMHWSQNRLIELVQVASITVILYALSITSSPFMRHKFGIYYANIIMSRSR